MLPRWIAEQSPAAQRNTHDRIALSRELVGWNLYGLPRSEMDGVNEQKALHNSHLLLPKSGAGCDPSLVRPPLVPDRDGPIPSHLLRETKFVLPPMNRRRLA